MGQAAAARFLCPRPLLLMKPRITLRRLWLALAPAGALLVLLGAYYLPGQAAEWVERLSPGCLFHRLTGLNCPGCGGTRALQAFLRGDWAAAWHYNIFLWLSLLLLAEEYVRLAWAELRGVEPLSSTRFYTTLLRGYGLAAVLWFILRNVLGI